MILFRQIFNSSFYKFTKDVQSLKNLDFIEKLTQICHDENILASKNFINLCYHVGH